MRAEDDFVEYAQAAAPRLRRTAYLLCQDWDLAQDYTQSTLAKMYVRWKRIVRHDNPHAYAKKVLLRVFFDQQRLGRSRENVVESLPETASYDSDTALRLTLFDALGKIPARDRAVVVLRYWEDHPVETVAEMLDMPVGTVKTQSARSLARLRAMLGAGALATLND